MRPMSLIAATFLLLPGISLADATVTLSVGYNHVDGETPRLPPPPPIYGSQVSTLDGDFSGSGLRATVDLSVSPLWTFQVGWAEFPSDSGTVTLVDVLGNVEVFSARRSGSARWLAYMPTIRKSRWEWSGKLGLADTEVKHWFSGRESHETLIGASGAYFFDNGFGIRLDAERLGGRATQFGLSLAYRF